MNKPSPIDALIAAGEALRKASAAAESDLYALWWNDGYADLDSSRKSAACAKATLRIRSDVLRAVKAWDRAASANRQAGARQKKKS